MENDGVDMAEARTGKARLGEPTLTASDWAEAALQLIAEKGLGALTISTLAARLGVTKGSFYWHFKGRDDLLAAALGRWERSIGDAIRSLDAIPDPRRRLELILDAASQPPRSRSLYAALAEAAEDPVVRKVLQRVASARIDYLEACYRGLGFPAPLAKATAVFAYAAYRGLLQLAHEAPASLPGEWASYAALNRQTFVPEGTRGRGRADAARAPKAVRSKGRG
jgi:AcrR family transcriptional regulator